MECLYGPKQLDKICYLYKKFMPNIEICALLYISKYGAMCIHGEAKNVIRELAKIYVTRCDIVWASNVVIRVCDTPSHKTVFELVGKSLKILADFAEKNGVSKNKVFCRINHADEKNGEIQPG